ncbi:phage holin family protein [Pseudomonas quasicaspiana]|uniref:phage holin family protein n=1 Tax=Pseudomonas quasicaspiana TaxID=2829821 RepID=UPI001E48DB23|nr:phage holin family protein [Pseudomonas quasicaspiana]MCD5977227.1 phage holin family protein [Pseudomonas quasicaspiana]
MDDALIAALLTQVTFWLCMSLFIRLFTFRRKGARFRRDMSCLAWLMMASAGAAMMYIGKGMLIVQVTAWPLVLILAVFVGSVYQSSGNLARVWKVG